MIGAIIGDIVGSRFEFNNNRNKNFALFTDECQLTDDSIITLAVAKAIMETVKIIKPSASDYHPDFYTLMEKIVVKYMQEIGQKYPDCGYGGMFSTWVFSSNPKPYNSFGNGAAMRISPPQAIVAFLESTSFEDAIRNAISVGGDSDTLAAITGAIAEAYYGVPVELKEKALTYFDNDLLYIFNDWCDFLGDD